MRYFTFDELTYSRTAVENGLSNRPGATERDNLAQLVERLLDPLRERLGEPIAILSGYRSPEVNSLVGGVTDSQHTLGEAADCYCLAGPERGAALGRPAGERPSVRPGDRLSPPEFPAPLLPRRAMPGPNPLPMTRWDKSLLAMMAACALTACSASHETARQVASPTIRDRPPPASACGTTRSTSPPLATACGGSCWNTRDSSATPPHGGRAPKRRATAGWDGPPGRSPSPLSGGS